MTPRVRVRGALLAPPLAAQAASGARLRYRAARLDALQRSTYVALAQRQHIYGAAVSLRQRGAFHGLWTVQAWLDGKHVVFGKVVKGMDVVKAIEEVGSSSGTTSKKVTVVKAGEIGADAEDFLAKD